MKKTAIRICDIHKHLKILDNALETVNSPEKQTLGKNHASYLKQTKSLLTAYVRKIKACNQHEVQPAANTQRLCLIKNILQFKMQALQTFLDHMLGQAIQLTESGLAKIIFMMRTAENLR